MFAAVCTFLTPASFSTAPINVRAGVALTPSSAMS